MFDVNINTLKREDFAKLSTKSIRKGIEHFFRHNRDFLDSIEEKESIDHCLINNFRKISHQDLVNTVESKKDLIKSIIRTGAYLMKYGKKFCLEMNLDESEFFITFHL